jgi:leucyl/phenylalanyl-tRNA--protein transferase
MFSRETDASKTAFAYLNKQLEQWDFKLVDCQVYTSHLESLGAKMIPRKEFITLLKQYAIDQGQHKKWSTNPDLSNQIIKSLSVK